MHSNSFDVYKFIFLELMITTFSLIVKICLTPLYILFDCNSGLKCTYNFEGRTPSKHNFVEI